MEKKELNLMSNLGFGIGENIPDLKTCPELPDEPSPPPHKVRLSEFKLEPKYVSKTGKNFFRVLRYRYDYRYKRHTIRLEMCCGQSRVIKFSLWDNKDIEGFQESVSQLKDTLKKGLYVYIKLDDLCILSYNFNHSSGISFYSTGFRIVGISSDEHLFE